MRCITHSKRSVQRIKVSGVVASRRIGKCGPHRNTTPAADHLILRQVSLDMRGSLKQQTATLQENDIAVSRSTYSLSPLD